MKTGKHGLHPECKTCKAKRDKAYRQQNQDIIKAKKREYQKKFYQENKELIKARNRKWRQENPGKVNAITAKRNAAKLERTPKWSTELDEFIIQEAYDLACERTQSTGVPHHVDHIIPLQGQNVSGLHVGMNLQVITAYENSKKSNDYDIPHSN